MMDRHADLIVVVHVCRSASGRSGKVENNNTQHESSSSSSGGVGWMEWMGDRGGEWGMCVPLGRVGEGPREDARFGAVVWGVNDAARG